MCEASATPTGFADIEALRLTDPGMVAFPHAAVVAPAVVVFGVFLLDRETVFVASLSPASGPTRQAQNPTIFSSSSCACSTQVNFHDWLGSSRRPTTRLRVLRRKLESMRLQRFQRVFTIARAT